MNVFLSWAGEESKHMANALMDWLPQVIQTLEPWMSTRIDKGDSWDGAIADKLNSSPVGIFCLTVASLDSKYLHYEAGAISNVKGAKACTLLLGIVDNDVKHPLARFQHTKFDKDDVLILLKTINSKMVEVGEKQISDERLKRALDMYWPELVQAYEKFEIVKPQSSSRSERELLEEILETVRDNSLNERETLMKIIQKQQDGIKHAYKTSHSYLQEKLEVEESFRKAYSAVYAALMELKLTPIEGLSLMGEIYSFISGNSKYEHVSLQNIKHILKGMVDNELEE